MVTKKRASKKSQTKKQPTKEGSEKGTCFIIMPFGDWFDYYYETIYVPAIESTDLTPRRADDLYRPSAIVNDIWDLTQQAKVVLADLSGKNPNVFYELGLAHALAKPAILVTESMDDVPFDLRSLRVIVYDKNEPSWGDKLQERIEIAINEILKSPIAAVLPTFLKVKESASKPTVSQSEKQLITMKQDIDLLKRELQARSEAPPRYSRPPVDSKNAKQYAKDSIRAGGNLVTIRPKLESLFGLSTQQARNIYFMAKHEVKNEMEMENAQSQQEPPNEEKKS